MGEWREGERAELVVDDGVRGDMDDVRGSIAGLRAARRGGTGPDGRGERQLAAAAEAFGTDTGAGGTSGPGALGGSTGAAEGALGAAAA